MTERKLRDFLGVREAAPGWEARIEAAQLIKEYVIAGAPYGRIPFGNEQDAWPDNPCHDCGVLKGQFHVEMICDTEECPRCHGQAIGCDCPYAGDEPVDLSDA